MSSSPNPFLPTTVEEVRAEGWDAPDVVFVTGDAYVDHPSFAVALLGRRLAAEGVRVAILAQPDWRSADPWRAIGRPRLCYAVSAGNLDSMVNHYTAAKKRRGEDAYSPGGRIGLRPDRATGVYAQRCREAFPGVPVIAGGVEASLRRVAHYDYWSDAVRPSVLVSSKADLVVYGIGEPALLASARRLAAGEPVAALRDLRGVAYLLGRREELPDHRWEDSRGDGATRELPSFEEVRSDRHRFAEATRILHRETNPFSGRRLTQRHGDRLLVVNPPALPMEADQLDRSYDQPFTRLPHPSYTEPIPAHAMIRDSVTIMRGCFGGCTFCSLTLHQGRRIQSRSERSVLAELERIAATPGFKGTVSDLGGPTANMYRMACRRPEVEAVCRRPSCVHPTVCKLLDTDHGPIRHLMRAARNTPGIARVLVASGIRMDLAVEDPEYVAELAQHHVGGHLKVAPEHVSPRVLDCMKKPGPEVFDEFAERFEAASARAGKEQYLLPYFITSHPGSGLEEMIELALYLRRRGYRPRQAQDFIPVPMDLATCMYHTGLDPLTMRPVESAHRARDRRLQRALLQFFLPENHELVRQALTAAGRTDLIGSGPDCLVPPRSRRTPRTRRAQDRRRP